MSMDDEDEVKVLEPAISNLPPPPTTKSSSFSLYFQWKLKLLLIGTLAFLWSVLAVSNSSYTDNKKAVTKLAQMYKLQPSNANQREEPFSIKANLKAQASNLLNSSKQMTLEPFNIPKHVWIYSEQNANETFLVQRCIENIQHFANMSNFAFTRINSQNFNQFITQNRAKSVTKLLTKLLQSKEKEDEEFYKIQEELISLSVLHENGGVLIAKDLLLTEDFTWIKDIASNPYVNRGNLRSKPQYIGFFDINAGSLMEKVKKQHAKHEYQRYMIRFPGVRSNFLVAVNGGQFLERVLEQYGRLLVSQGYLKSMIQEFDLKLGTIQQKNIKRNLFTVAAHIVLQVQQFEIQKRFADKSQVNWFSVDHYGLFTINNRYFIDKIPNIFENNFHDKITRNLARYTLEELQQTTGPLRYVVNIYIYEYLDWVLKRAVDKQQQQYIHPDSFIAKIIFLGKQQYAWLFQKDVEISVVNSTARRWDALPKIIWLFWNKGISQAGIGNRLCIENLRRNAETVGFEVRELNNSNIVYYIGKDLNARFDDVIKNRKIPTFAQTKSNFVRKAIVYKYGGIYLDVSYFGIESLEWILDIAKYPTQYIFNRYGEMPRLFMFFHPHYGQPFNWKYDKRANTKRQDLTAYENNLIIAEPGHELLLEWIDEYALTITTDYKDTQERMKKYGVAEDAWTNPNDLYLTSMDSLKNVIGRRQRELDQKAKEADYKGPLSASEYYGIWSMSGYRGQQKIRAYSNFDNNYYINPQSSDNVFLYRFSQDYVEGILGKAKQLIKLYNWNIHHFTDLLEGDFDSGFTNEIHPDSYSMRYLIDPVKSRIQKKVDVLRLAKQ